MSFTRRYDEIKHIYDLIKIKTNIPFSFFTIQNLELYIAKNSIFVLHFYFTISFILNFITIAARATSFEAFSHQCNKRYKLAIRARNNAKKKRLPE